MRALRVLVVEDDDPLGVFLKKGLRLEGHEVEWVGDGDAAVERALERPPDLVVLDLGLPGQDGMEVLETLRRELPEVAVLVLTGRRHVDERVRCLNLGADDFLQKPFSFHELAARCRAILRRTERSADPTLQYAGIEMRRMERKVSFRGTPVELTSKEFLLLESLLRRRGECCTRAELLEEVWQSRGEAAGQATANVLDVYVTYLRKKLAGVSGAEQESVIETVRGEGYRLRTERKPPMSERGGGALPLARGA